VKRVGGGYAREPFEDERKIDTIKPINQ